MKACLPNAEEVLLIARYHRSMARQYALGNVPMISPLQCLKERAAHQRWARLLRKTAKYLKGGA